MPALGHLETIWLRGAHSRFTSNCGLTSTTPGRLFRARSGTNAGGDLELIFEQIGMDLIFFTPPPRDDGTSWALASPERH